MPRKFDIPQIADDLNAPLLLDANFGFYQLSENLPGANVYVELYAQRKATIKPPVLLIESGVHGGAFLVKQDNYSDIGGGVMTYQRHFTELPNDRVTKGFSSILNTLTWTDTINIEGDILRRVTMTRGGSRSTDEIPRTTIWDFQTANFLNFVEVYDAFEINTVATYRFNEEVFGRSTVFESLKTYDVATKFDDLSSSQKQTYIAEKLEELQSDFPQIVVNAGQPIGTFRVRPLVVQIVESTFRAPANKTTITPGTRTLAVGGVDYDIFDGSIAIAEE